jgi:HSP20 family protein
VLAAELPGLSREQIDIHAEAHLIVIRGHRNSRPAGSDVSCEQYHRVERGHGHFSRAFTLPEAIDVEAVSAELREGILTVTLPKVSDRSPRRVNVT